MSNLLRSLLLVIPFAGFISGCVQKNNQNTCVNIDNSQLISIDKISRSQQAFDIIQKAKLTPLTRSTLIQPLAICNFAGGNISGTIQYQDKTYNANGFTGATKLNPVRNARIGLLDCNGAAIADTDTITDSTGNFTITGAPAASGLAIYADSAVYNHPITIYSLADSKYRYDSVLPATATGLSIDITSDQYAGAFNLLDVMQSSREYATAMMAANGSTFPNNPLNVYWTQGNTTPGSSFFAEDISDVNTGQILVLSGNPATQDTDEFDDDVLHHEFGHFVEFALGQYDAVAFNHALNVSTLNIDLAWSEGFANYIAIASKEWLVSQSSTSISHETIPNSWYLDTLGADSYRVSFDFGTLDMSYCSTGDCYTYATSETATANALWQMNQNANIGEAKIWQTLAAMSSTPAYLDNRMYSSSFEIFYDASVSYISKTDLTPMLEDRLIDYSEDLYDQFTNDGSIVNASTLPLCQDSNCPGQQHTLYRTDASLNEDVDFLEVILEQGKSYLFETFDLTNGADTELALFNANGTLLTTPNEGVCNEPSELNDIGSIRKNDGAALSSRVVFEATKTGSYYLKVSSHSFSNTSNWYGAGRYGGYNIRGFPLP